jgi:hypothetical protein
VEGGWWCGFAELSYVGKGMMERGEGRTVWRFVVGWALGVCGKKGRREAGCYVAILCT